MIFKSHLPAFLIFAVSCAVAGAKVVEYDLTIAQEPWAPAGMKPVSSLTVNGGIPGPTLRFQEGDIARIRVHNQLPKETTSIHWHGHFPHLAPSSHELPSPEPLPESRPEPKGPDTLG